MDSAHWLTPRCWLERAVLVLKHDGKSLIPKWYKVWQIFPLSRSFHHLSTPSSHYYTTLSTMATINMPPLPVAQHRFIEYVAAHPTTPMSELLHPFKQHEDELRKVFAQQPEHAITKELNLVPVFNGHEQDVKIRARDLTAESGSLKEKYIMPLKTSERKLNGAWQSQTPCSISRQTSTYSPSRLLLI